MASDPYSGVIEAGVNAGTGIAGLFSAQADRALAAERMRQMAEAWNIPLPVLEQMVAETQGSSAMEGVHADPNLVGAQNDALGQLQNISDAGGMTLEDKVNNDQLQRQAAQRAQAQRQSIVNTLSRGGQAPGGVSAALQLGAQRDQQEAGALAGAKTAADARRRATEAVLQRGRMAGDMREQGFSEGTARARAADEIARYNAQAKERTQRYNLGLPQQQFQNRQGLASGKSGAAQAAAGFATANADRTQRTFADAGAGLGRLGSGIYDSIRKDEDEDNGGW